MAKYRHTCDDLGRTVSGWGYDSDETSGEFIKARADNTHPRLHWLLSAAVSELVAMRREMRQAMRDLPKKIVDEMARREAKVARAVEAAKEKAERDLVKARASAEKELARAEALASKGRIAEIEALSKLPPPQITVVQVPNATIEKLAAKGFVSRKF